MKTHIHMVLDIDRFLCVERYGLPKRYIIRTYQHKDKYQYLELMHRAGFNGFKDTNRLQELCLPNGIFVCVFKPSNTIVSTTTAMHHPTKDHPFGGEISWVATDIDHRGQGLARAICVEAIERLLRAEYNHVYLMTDEWRWKAIRLYLDLGFFPHIPNKTMATRWKNIGGMK